MGIFTINKGRDIQLKGAAEKTIAEIPLSKYVAVQPQDFKGLRLRLEVKVGDSVKVGTTVLSDKINPDITVASPASGKVIAINRGEKRAMLSVVIETDRQQDAEVFPSFREEQLTNISKTDVIGLLLKGHLWPTLRQRPFSKVANPQEMPKAIFIHAMNTEPLAPDLDFVLEGKAKEFQNGIKVLSKLTDGDVHLCVERGDESKTLTQDLEAKAHAFSGPHPAGNVSTHIHCVDPINKGDTVWYIEAQDVLRVAALFTGGTYSADRIVAVTGEGAKGHQVYAQTVVGAPVSALLGGNTPEGMRYFSGSVLAGKDVGPEGFVCFYDSQVTIIPEGGKREFLGWLAPGFSKYTFSRTFASAFLPKREMSLDTDKHGGDRAIVLNNIYDELVPLDIMTYFLLKAILSGNIEEAEELGILECDGEDFALCTFSCPSKTNVGEIINEGLALIESEE